MQATQIGLVLGVGMAASAWGQNFGRELGAAGSIVARMRAVEPGGVAQPRLPIVASLSYDGNVTYGFAGQDFESLFDMYDTFCCETFWIDQDARLSEFRTASFSTGNAFGTTDVIAEIYGIEDLEDLCDDGDLPEPMLRTTPGAGFYDGENCVSDFDGQCLPAGSYVLRWGAALDFTTFGQMFMFAQFGEHDNGGGDSNDGFQSNPGNAFGLGFCFREVIGLAPGINFVLCGDAGDCDDGCGDVTGCGDWDGDGDSDGDDFFDYLDGFIGRDPCADIDLDGDFDAADFFLFLDRFVSPC